MGNAVDPTSILEQIKRARLYNPNFGAGQAPAPVNTTIAPNTPQQSPTQDQTQQGQLPVQSAPPAQQVPTQQPQVQAPPQNQPSPRDQALSEYRQMMQSGAPSESDYKPSITRRIIGALLGAGVGITNSSAGKELAHQTVYGPYDKSLSDYQKKLAQKKEAYETESSAEQETAKVGEQVAQKGAEEKRAGSEEANRKRQEFEISPAGQAAKLKLAQVEHPNTPKPPKPYELELKNGKTIPLAYEDQNGQFKDDQGNIYEGGPEGPIKNARVIGTNIPKSSTEKPVRGGEDGAIDQWTQEHGRAPNYSERLSIHRQYADAPKDSGSGDFRKEIQMQSARQAAQRPYQRNLDLSTAQLDRIDRSISMISTAKPEDIALAIPEILTALVSGQSTGVRITQPEMNSMIHARGLGESVEAFVNKIKGQGNLSDKQKSDLKGLLSDVQSKVKDKQRDLSDVMDEIDNSNSPTDLGKAQVKYRKKLNDTKSGELPGGITLDDINKEIARRKGVQQ